MLHRRGRSFVRRQRAQSGVGAGGTLLHRRGRSL